LTPGCRLRRTHGIGRHFSQFQLEDAIWAILEPSVTVAVTDRAGSGVLAPQHGAKSTVLHASDTSRRCALPPEDGRKPSFGWVAVGHQLGGRTAE
jgi:hypothetical protein